MLKKILILSIIFTLFLPCLKPIQASEFTPGFILTDIELRDSSSMGLGDINLFLYSKPGLLKNLTFEDVDGQKRSAADIIFRAATRYQMNPKYLLVLLQKEQSLIEDPNPSQNQLDWATGYAVCDSCSKDDPLIQKFKGFAKQVDKAAWRNKYYIDNSWEFRHQPGKTYEIDGQSVNIFNQATANLYNYTPHIHGNFNFWKLWNRYFTQKYPDGSLLQIQGEPGVWLIQNGYKKPFHSKGALISRFDINNIITINKNDLSQYPAGNPIKFAQYSLLSDPDGNIYLLSDDKLRHISNEEVFRTIGFNYEEITQVPENEIDLYEPGDPITLNTAYPAGALLQNNETGGVYFVQNGIKHPIITQYVLKINYSNYHITQVSPDELDKYDQGELVQINDGELIKSFDCPDVFVISNGKKMKIASEKVFDAIGYKWNNIKVIDPVTLLSIPSGGDISLNYLENQESN